MADNGLPQGFTLDESSSNPPPSSGASASLPSGFSLDDEKFGTLGQQALTAIEGSAKGLLGPLATAGEAALSHSGVPGLSPAEQTGRAETNPWTHGLSEAATFVGGALTGTGEAALIGHLGEAAAKATGLGLEGASLISKVAAGGIKTGAEMAALQAGDELSKTINEDPNQSLGTAAINVGLSGLIGGAGGSVIGAVSPLFKATVEKTGLPKLIDDAKAQFGFRQSLNGTDVPSAITEELTTRLNEVENMRSQIGRLKGDAIARALPEMNDHILGQVNGTIQQLESEIEKMRANPTAYPERLVKKLEQNLDAFKSKVFVSGEAPQPIEAVSPDFSNIPKTVLGAPRPTPARLAQMSESGAAADAKNLAQANAAGYNPYGAAPKSSAAKPQEIFNAMQDLKGSLQDYSKGNYGPFAVKSSDEAYDFIHATKSLGHDVRVALEDSKIWGDAGDIQRKTNAAIKASIDAERDAISKFTQKSAAEGGRVVDPVKINTLVNQSLKNKAGLKGDFIGNYTKLTDDLADTINKIHTDAGLEAPVRLTPTPALDHTLGRSSPGIHLGNWLYDKGLASVAGHTAGEAIGAGAGALVGHPVLGAIAGEKLLAPALISIAKPILENASHSQSFKSALDYAVNILRGGKVLSQAAVNFFRSGSEIIPKNLMPTVASRDRLEKSLDYAANQDNALKIGGHLSHYLPDHSVAAAATAATASQYFSQLKPKRAQANPLDKPAPVDRFQQAKYERQLDIAQQPLLVLQHAKEGTLQAQDVKTLNVLYPGLAKKMGTQIYGEMVKSISEGKQVPYKQRLSLGLLLAQPLDSTMTPLTMQSIMLSNAPKAAPPQAQGKPKKASKSTASSMEKVNKLYATPQQAREASRAGS